MNVYFDNAATTQVRDEVINQISDILKDCFGNPSSTHSFGRTAKSYIESSRKKIAEILNCEPSEIIFNSGGTESDNSLLRCSVKDLGIKTIISSKIEHHAVTHTLDELEKEGVEVKYIDLDEKTNYGIYINTNQPLGNFQNIKFSYTYIPDIFLRQYDVKYNKVSSAMLTHKKLLETILESQV